MAGCILLDIEGTVCPISFVKETLFPYAIQALPQVLATKWNDPDFVPYRDAFPEEHRQSPGLLQAHVEDLTKRDVKIAYLKNLQGYLWENGYKTGAYATTLFPDVVPQLRAWKDDGYTLAIYSSGSVFAQKLLFGYVRVEAETLVAEPPAIPTSQRKRDRPDDQPEDQAVAEPPPSKRLAADSDGGHETQEHVKDDLESAADDEHSSIAPALDNSDVGRSATVDTAPSGTEDLAALFDGWFDTTNAGLKTETASYTKIAEALKWKPEEILFLSDNVREVDAALAAGMRSTLVDRPGNAPIADADRSRLDVVEVLHDVNVIGPSACDV